MATSPLARAKHDARKGPAETESNAPCEVGAQVLKAHEVRTRFAGTRIRSALCNWLSQPGS